MTITLGHYLSLGGMLFALSVTQLTGSLFGIVGERLGVIKALDMRVCRTSTRAFLQNPMA